MNILFVGPYKQVDEWGRKSRYLLNALKKTQYNITSRPLYFSSNFQRYVEPAEHRSFDSYDAVIQFTLAPFCIYDGYFKKNIGIFNLSTKESSTYVPVSQKTELLDELWVDSTAIKDGLDKQSTRTNIKYLSPFVDADILNRISADPVIARVSPQFANDNRFSFYSIIGGLEEKIGLNEMLTAYYSAFSMRDKVVLNLIIENRVDPAPLQALIEQSKAMLGAIRPPADFPAVSILNSTDHIPDPSRMKIHEECDCFISSEYSLNVNTLAIEAACFGNTPIINKGNEAYNVLGEENSWGVESYEESCLLTKRPFPDMFTAYETCSKPIVNSLRDQMYEAYVNKFKRDAKKEANRDFRAGLESPEYYKELENALCS